MQKSPFKFLDSYSKEDRDIFFGRDKEIEELYSGIFKSRILIVYGTSGTGKSSLIDCGLANKFSDLDWLPVNIRRGPDINRSLIDSLNKTGITKVRGGSNENDIIKVIQSIYLDHFRPIYLIFDQFEELFIFGSREEKEELAGNVKKIIESDLQCKFIFSIREEYLASLTEFEKSIPSFLANRTRIEKMTRQNAIRVIEGPCKLNGIEVESGFPELLLEKLNPDTSDIELTWLQVYLDKLFRMASDGSEDVRLTKSLLERAGEVKDLLGTFLEEQVSQLDDSETGLVVLKSFVSVKGTRHQNNEEEVVDYTRTLGKNIDSETIKGIIQKFIRLRILRDKDENGRYELRHDTLAAKIYEMITLVEKELLEIRQFLDHSYNSFEKRGTYLSAEDLKYIAPYEDKLFLNEKVSKYISQSKWAIQKAKRRRQRILVSSALLIITILSFFTVWAVRERNYARLQETDAKLQKEKADSAAAVADSSRIVAEVSRIAAIDSGKKALEQRDFANIQRRRAERNEAVAIMQSNIAARQTDSANNASRRAERNAIRAEQERIEALRLRMLSVGKALSIKSLQLQGQKDLQTLLSYQSYVFNLKNGGNPGDADIYQGLYNVSRQYASSGYKIFSGHNGEIKSIAFIPGKNEFYSSGFDGKLIRWSYNGGEQSYQVIYSGTEIIEVLAVSPDGSWLACGGRNSVITMMPVGSGNDVQYELKGHLKQVNSLVFSGDGRYLWSSSLDGEVIKWDIAAKSPSEFNTGGILINSLDLSSDNVWLAGISNDGKAELWNLTKPSDKLSIELPGKIIKTIEFKPGENKLALGCSDGYVEFWDIQAGRKISGMNAHTAGVNSVRFNPALQQIATAGNDRTIRIWDEKDLTAPPITLSDNEGYVMAIEFSPDGKMIVSGTYEGANNLTGRATGADILAKEISGLITRKLTPEEWSMYIGKDIEYETLY